MDSRKKILIVEDETIVAMEVQERLKSIGYDVCGAAMTGEEAINQASETRPDLLLMDIMLKGEMDGIKAAEHIQSKLEVPVIYLTAHSDETTLQRAKITSPFGYILKPFDEKNLHTIIEMAFYRHDIERKLKERERWFYTTLRSIGEAVIATDTKGHIQFMNPVAESLTGWNQNEAIDLKLTKVLNLINVDNRAPIDNPVQKVLQECAVSNFTNHTILIAKDGKERHINECAAPIKDDNDHILGVVLIFRDVTEQIILQEQLHHAQKMECLGMLSGGVAHDFNNVLGAILGYASFMKTRIQEDHSFYKFIETIETSARRGAELTDKLLSFSRSKQHRTKLINLNDTAKEALKILRRTFDKNIEIVNHFHDELPFVEADDGQLVQLVMNLCINARDAMPDGGKLILETGTTLLDNKCVGTNLEGKSGSFAWLSVADTGIGMDKETLRRIYEPFFTTKGEGKGTGLGLSVVFGIVKNHGGYISVYSEPGDGSVFKVYLPVSTKIKSQAVAKTRKPQGGNELILVVDDDDSIREFIRDALQEYGYHVLLAENGEAALELLRENNGAIDLVILDVAMPKLGGRETFIKMKEINPNVKTLISTGYSRFGKIKEILESGVKGFIQKPYRVDDLLEKIRKVLDRDQEIKAVA